MTTQSDWIEWKGGGCPVPEGTEIYVRYRDGAVFHGKALMILFDGNRSASPDFWCNADLPSDIVAYRVLDAKAGDRS